MTAQAADSLVFRCKQFLVCGANGPELFVPAEFGLKPEMPSTACYRGWMAEYAVVERLELADLYVFHDAGTSTKNRSPYGPAINGVTPQDPNSWAGFNCLYKGLNLPLSFTGGLLIGHGLIRRLLVNMGFHSFWKFEELHELTFEKGLLVTAVDKSQVGKTAREKHLVQGVLGHPDISDEKAVTEWIEQSFSLRYQI